MGAELDVRWFDNPKTGIKIRQVADLPSKPFFLDALTVNPSSCPHPKKLGDAAVDRLVGLEKLRTAHFYGAAVTDAGAAKLANISSLVTVTLRNVSIGDAGVLPLLKLPKLQRLNVMNTGVTDRTLEAAAECRGLVCLEVGQCSQITAAGLDRLKQALPQCEVISNFGTYRPPPK